MNKTAISATAALGTLLVAVAGAPSAAAAPAAPEAGTRKYIVTSDSNPVANGLVERAKKSGGKVHNVYSSVLPGFSVSMTAAEVRQLKGERHVTSITPDAVVRSTTTQTNPTWGLDRVDQRSPDGDDAYRYGSTGAGVTAFVLDTGVRLAHSQFGARATSGYDFVDDDANASDCDGHGTHVSGTIAGSTFGVAKSAKVVSVRVLDCYGSGWWSDTIDALDWVVAHKPKGPSVINLSLGSSAYPLVDEAVARTVAAGIPVVVAAGNDGADACNQSPARTPQAITVAASSSEDWRADFSNYGSCVDLFAPGVDVRSASNASNTASEYLSGTSMATPHVAGVVARYLQIHPGSTPAQTAAALVTASTKSVVKDAAGSPNRLLYAARTSVPGLPTSVTASKSDTAKTATIKWSAPSSNGGKAVTSYRVSRNGTSSTGVGPLTVTVSSTSRSYTFKSLRKGTAYTLSVRAVNSVGAGDRVSKKLTALR